MRRTILIAFFAFIFGAVTAFLSFQIFNSIDVDGEHPRTHWYDGLMVSSAPGALMNKFFKIDLSNPTESRIESENVIPIMLLNGLGWTASRCYFGELFS